MKTGRLMNCVWLLMILAVFVGCAGTGARDGSAEGSPDYVGRWLGYDDEMKVHVLFTMRESSFVIRYSKDPNMDAVVWAFSGKLSVSGDQLTTTGTRIWNGKKHDADNDKRIDEDEWQAFDSGEVPSRTGTYSVNGSTMKITDSEGNTDVYKRQE